MQQLLKDEEAHSEISSPLLKWPHSNASPVRSSAEQDQTTTLQSPLNNVRRTLSPSMSPLRTSSRQSNASSVEGIVISKLHAKRFKEGPKSPSSDLSRAGSRDGHEMLMKELDDEEQAAAHQDFGLLAPADSNVLREIGKIPLHERVWDDNSSEKAAVEILMKVPAFSRFDASTVRILCHAAQFEKFQKGQFMASEGERQMKIFIIISGTVAGYVHGAKKVSEDTQARGRPGLRRSLSMSKLTADSDICRLHSGQYVGFDALLVGWTEWPVSYVATTKVEVLAIPRSTPGLKAIEKSLKWSFDSRKLIDVLQEYAKASKEIGRHVKHQHDSENAEQDADARPEEWVKTISLAMRGIPFFRQLPQEEVEKMANSIEMQEFHSRQVVWEQSQGVGPLSDRMTNSDSTEADAASMLHVVLRGEVWVFRKEGPLSLKKDMSINLQDVWNLPKELSARVGQCFQILVECDSMGYPTQLAHDCTMIAQPGTVLVRICNPKNTTGIKSCSIVHLLGRVRGLLSLPESAWSQLEKEKLTSIMTRDVSFFRHIAPSNVEKLLEQATLEKMRKGDLLIRQGDDADYLYIILNGTANAHRCRTQSQIHQLPTMWSKWEMFRSKQDYTGLGKVLQTFGTGKCVGESEVVEKAPFRTTVVANDEMEVIRISATVYTTVMWDLCDGEALEVEKIRRILSVPPSVRERDDTDELIDMLEDSDFLSQFPRDLQIQMSKGMKLLDYNEDELICQQNSTGDTLFLVVSGSVALHRTDASTGAGETDKQDARSNQSSHTWAGPCRRVLGVGDSFGELAFMQGRAHPTSAIARAQSTLIAMRQVEMEAHAVARMLSFVANPRSEAMEEVFAKDVHDRNEKDIMLLINYLEMNPFLKELLYPVMVDCAHSILRHEVPVGQQLHTDDISPGLSETRMYIVNGGSMEITPRVKNSPILIQLREITSQPATFGEKLQGNRRRGRARNQKVLFSGQLFVAAVERPKISEEGSRPTTSPRSLLTPNTNNPKRRVFGIDLSGLITYTSTIRDSGLTEVGYVSEICSLERTEIPDFTYALNMYIRGEQWVIASHVRSEYDAFINVLCDFNPYFNSIMKSDDNVFAQELVQLFRGELGWKNILLRIENNGQVSYSSNLSPDAKTEWLVIGTMQNCLDCEESPTREKPSAMKLNMASSFDNEHNVEWLFSTGSEAETQAWLNRFCLKCSQDVLNARFEKQNYGESALRSTLAIHSMLSRVLEHKRLRKLETKQRLARASLGNAKNKKKSCRDPKFDAISMDASVFVGYGSAFCTDGKGIANDEGCTLFSLSYGEWDRIRRRQIELESENVIQMVRNLPMLALASHRDLYNLTMNSFVNNFIMGEKVACSNLSSMHIHVVLTGTCKLRRVGRKEKHTDKMRYRLQSSLNSSSAIGDVRMCASCRGGGLEGTIPALTDRIKLCKDCNGLGQLVERPQDAMDVTDVSELRKGAILTRSIPCMDSLADYELMPTSSPFQLLVLRSDLWSTLKERLEKFGTAEPEPKVEITAADLTAKLLDNARKVRETVKKGPVKIHNPHQRFVKRLSIEEKAHRLAEKAHSACTRQIDKLLMISRPPLSNVYVDSKRDVSSPTCKLPPPRTIKNKFTGPVPALNFERIFGDELRSVFLTNSPSKERGSRGSWKDSLLSPVKKLSITLKPLSEQHITGDLPEVLATSRSRPGDLGYAPKITLKYGNAFALDDRQKRIYRLAQELMSPSNYPSFSSASITVKKADGQMPERTVNQFEFFNVLERYKLLEQKVTHERVIQLQAICKADAMQIFKKCGRTDQGGNASRLSQAKFCEAIQMVASLLQTPLNGQPDGKTIRARVLKGLTDPRAIQNANTASLTEHDKFVSQIQAKQDMQTEMDAVENASIIALASITRAVTPGYESQSPELKDILRSKPLKDDLGTERGADSTVARLSFLD